MSAHHLHDELHFLIAKYLTNGPCSRAGEVLIEQLEQNQMIPNRFNWLGESFKQDFKAYNKSLSHIRPEHLIRLLEKLLRDSDESRESTDLIRGNSLLSIKACSLPTRKMDGSYNNIVEPRSSTLFRRCSQIPSTNCVQAFFGRDLFGKNVATEILKPDIYPERLHLACRTWGHLSAVYCILIDVTGKYIFTGADDKLVKIWSLDDGRLLCTLRGSSSEITDLAVSYENTILAASSNDRLIRIWCLRTGEPLATLNKHTGSVTSIFFCPMPRSRTKIRYLASTSTDGSCAFWSYTEEPGRKANFAELPTLYLEKMRPGSAQMICASFSAGGVFMAAGSADNNVRVYYMLGAEGPERILEVENHTDRVDSISFAHRSVRFISGSRDGTALVWRYEHQQWLFVRIMCSKQMTGDPPFAPSDPKQKLRVTMVGWNADDTLVLTAISNHLIKVWNPCNGNIVRVLRSHRNEIFCVEPNPIIPGLICTAGHDGNLFVWDIGTLTEEDPESGKQLFSYHNDLPDGQGFGCIFDVKWASDGFSFAATDSHGNLLIFHSSKNEKFEKLPSQLFFHTDYRPITRDGVTNIVYDEQTQVEPHLMPPPFLVDVDGNPYPPSLQRLVPGRQNCKDEQLIPNVAVEDGFLEVIEGVPFQIPRSNIDQMIAELARVQRGAPQERNENYPQGSRRSGEAERVRQENWQAREETNFGLSRKRSILPKLNISVLRKSEQIRHAFADEEEEYYQTQKRIDPPSGTIAQNSTGFDRITKEFKSRRVRQLAAVAAERRRQAELGEIEQHAVEGIARPNPPQQERSVAQNPGRRNPLIRHGLAQRRRRARYSVRIPNPEQPGQSDHESSRSESSFSSSDVSASSSSESSDSDWGGGPVSASPRKPTSVPNERRRTARNASASSPEVKQEVVSDMDYEEPQPGPSSQMTKIKSEAQKPRPARRTKRAIIEDGGLEEIPEIYRPSEWLSELVPKKSPYFPQLGDDLVYFRQGHDSYIDEVKSKNIYPLSKKYLKSLPWHINPLLPTEVPVRVMCIKFEIRPPRLAALKLAVTDWETGELTGQNINVVYHDVSNIVDFLVLRQIYDKSMRHKWNSGDKFRCLIDRVWWIGTIKSVAPLSTNFPNSKFLCYSASWANGDVERMSPWDLEVIPDDFDIPIGHTKEEGIPASEEDLHSDLYEAGPRDWPPFGHQDVECQRISGLIEKVMGLAFAEHFLTPVDLNKYPEYVYETAYPIDLNTIKTRLENRFYRRLGALKSDIKYIASNAEHFNRPMTDIVKKARIIRDLCLQISSQPELTEVTGTYHTLAKNFKWDKEEPGSSGSAMKAKGRQARISKEDLDVPLTNGNESNSSKLRPRIIKARRSGRNNGELSMTWQESCKELLNKLWQSRDSEPFRKAVDPTEYPDYYRRIDTPMDLMSVKEDLLGGNYSTPHDFTRDMRLIFSNSKTYNTDRHSQIYIMTIRLNSMFECQMSPILDDFKCRRNRSRKGELKFNATPTKSGRSGNSRRSVSESPRKNPRRNAATKNPYVHSNQESNDTSEAEEEPVADEDQYRDHRRKRRRRHGDQTGKVTRRSSLRQTRSQDVNPEPQSLPPRKVKRFVITSSGGSDETPKPSVSPKASCSTRNGRQSRSATTTPRKNYVKEEPGSEDEENEFEESDQMPEISKQSDDSDNVEGNASTRKTQDGEYRLRRSRRVGKTERNRGNIGRRQISYHEYDEEDDSDRSGRAGRKTRFGGKRATNYQEYGSAEEEQLEPEEEKLTLADRVKQQSRRNSYSNTSSNGFSKRENSNRRNHESEPEEDEEDDDSNESNEDEDEGGEEEQSSNDDQPGPSSKLRDSTASRTYHALRSQSRVKEEEEEEYIEEEQEEEGEVEEEEGEEEDAESEDDEEEQNYTRRPLGRKRSKRRMLGVGARKRPRRIMSHEEGFQSKRSSTGRMTKKQVDRTINIREMRQKPSRNYREESDEDDYHPDIHVKVTVSSRGRLRRRKSYLAE